MSSSRALCSWNAGKNRKEKLPHKLPMSSKGTKWPRIPQADICQDDFFKAVLVFQSFTGSPKEHCSQREDKNIYRCMQLAVGQTACAELSTLRHVILYTSVTENRITSVVLHHVQCPSHSLLLSILSHVCRRLQLLKLWQKCQPKHDVGEICPW